MSANTARNEERTITCSARETQIRTQCTGVAKLKVSWQAVLHALIIEWRDLTLHQENYQNYQHHLELRLDSEMILNLQQVPDLSLRDLSESRELPQEKDLVDNYRRTMTSTGLKPALGE